jgi:methylated-DNA-[protein]-cysteine S-methyltransferase
MAGKEKREIYCCRIKSDRLHIYLASSEKGAIRIGLALDKGPSPIAYFSKDLPGQKLFEDEALNYDLIEAVETALAGKVLSGRFELDIEHTPFQIRVWKGITQIPFGKTMTYGEVAAMTGCPKGARAIGNAMSANPLPLIFPCHRVVAAGGGLGGFRGGLELKSYLLKREKHDQSFINHKGPSHP